MIKTKPVTEDPKISILVVDDQEDMRIFFRRVLEKSNYTVTAAESGEVALDYINKEHFDLVLLDIIMPGINGITVLKTVRKRYSKKDLPIIMVTVKGEEDDIEDALYFGANEYIVKPISYLELLVRVRDFLTEQVQEDI